MDENHQDKTGSKQTVTEEKLWLPPLSPKYQKKLGHLHNDGFLKATYKRTGFANKTLWDWLQLLIIPFVLAVGGFWFNAQQNYMSLQMSDRQHRADLQIAATRYANDQQLAADQQRETILKTYLDDMSDLLLNHNLRKSKSGDEVSQLARERTLTTLRRLDAGRNRIVLQFLQDAHLIGVKNTVVDLVDLSDADLSGDDLRGVSLSDANLSWDILITTKLSDAILENANLSHSLLDSADLSGAYLVGANLSEAGLLGVNLSDANLTSANLNHARVTQEQLSHAQSLQGTIMPNGSIHP